MPKIKVFQQTYFVRYKVVLWGMWSIKRQKLVNRFQNNPSVIFVCISADLSESVFRYTDFIT